MKVLSYIKGLDGSSYHRVFMPNQTINADVKHTGNLTEEDLEWCDILHYSRHSQMSFRFFDEMRKKHGFKIVIDNDDSWDVYSGHPKEEFWNKSGMPFQIMGHIANADAVICTTDYLAGITSNLNKNVFVLPNALDYGKGQFKYRKQKKSDRVRLLYASTVMNYPNTAIIAKAMKKLVDLPIEVVIAGHHDSPLFDILVKNLTDGQIPHRFIPWAKSEEYMLTYDGDIGILPSKDIQFNKCKSNLKVLEYAALKIPVVCSNADPYRGLPVNYFNGENQFVDQIRSLMDPAVRKSSGEDLYKFCKENYNLRSYADRRLEIYKSL